MHLCIKISVRVHYFVTIHSQMGIRRYQSIIIGLKMGVYSCIACSNRQFEQLSMQFCIITIHYDNTWHTSPWYMWYQCTMVLVQYSMTIWLNQFNARDSMRQYQNIISFQLWHANQHTQSQWLCATQTGKANLKAYRSKRLSCKMDRSKTWRWRCWWCCKASQLSSFLDELNTVHHLPSRYRYTVCNGNWYASNTNCGCQVCVKLIWRLLS